MPKFFVDKENIIDNRVVLSGDDVKHITKVLRKEVGDSVEISDGCGNKYLVSISSINNNKITADILIHQVEKDTNINVTLFQALPKLTKMDAVIQKCTELGINSIIPFVSGRTIVEIKDEKSKVNKLQRWQKIVFEASKQCQRASVPTINTIYKWEQVLEAIEKYDLAIIAYENENKSLKEVLIQNNKAKNVCIIIGPEGGFDESEINEIINKGATSISLGKRILRTETAGMALLSIIMYELDEMEK